MPTDKNLGNPARAAASVRRRPGMLRLVLQPDIARAALKVSPVSYTHLTLPTTPYV